jgi:hypothetical protein
MGDMGSLRWLTENWFTLLNVVGVIGGLFFTGYSLRSETKTRRIANPPFNVNSVKNDRLQTVVCANRGFPLGLQRLDNANYLRIELFHYAFNEKGRVGFVIANTKKSRQFSPMKIAGNTWKHGAAHGLHEPPHHKRRCEKSLVSLWEETQIFTPSGKTSVVLEINNNFFES